MDTTGRIDFAGLASDRAGLEDVVKFIAAVDPVSAPTRFLTVASQLAYYIDAYNALAMYGVLDAGVPERFGRLGRIRFFYLRNSSSADDRFPSTAWRMMSSGRWAIPRSICAQLHERELPEASSGGIYRRWMRPRA